MTDTTAHPVSEELFETQKKAPPKKSILLAVIVSLVCSTAFPLVPNPYIATAASLVCAVFIIIMSSRRILSAIALVLFFGAFGFDIAMPIIAFLLSAVVGCGAFAWLISSTESPYLAIIPSFAFALCTIMTKNWFASFLTIIFVFPAIMLANAYDNKKARVSALFRAGIGFIAFIVLTVIFSVYYFTGELRIDVITEALDVIKEYLAKLLASINTSMLNGQTEPFFSEEQANNTAAILISLIPAITVCLCNLIAYFSQKVQFSIIKHTEGAESFDSLRTVFIMSPISAVVFILSFFIETIASASYDKVVATVCSNLYLILIPGLALMGAKAFFSPGIDGYRRIGCGTALISILFVFLLFFNVQAAVLMAACFGAYTAIEIPLRKHFSKKDQ